MKRTPEEKREDIRLLVAVLVILGFLGLLTIWIFIPPG